MVIRRPSLRTAPGPLSEILLFFGQLALLATETLWFIARGRISLRDTVRQMSEVGVGSLLVAIITVGFSGAVTALYLAAQLVQYGQGSYVGLLVGKSLALEIAPVITAIVVAARSGSAMAAELGSMTVTEQVDALKTMATSPVEYLVVPRVVGTMLMMPVVTVLANLAGLYGASLTSEMGGLAHTLFWSSFQGVLISDQISGLLKSIPFGALIALIGCRQGLATTGGAQGVGRATTSAVVFGSIAIYVVDFFISLVMQDVAKLW
ncbi:ABC transporter permease [bacterium]|nr:MAG: ABC transporter permease [bacterium]